MIGLLAFTSAQSATIERERFTIAVNDFQRQSELNYPALETSLPKRFVIHGSSSGVDKDSIYLYGWSEGLRIAAELVARHPGSLRHRDVTTTKHLTDGTRVPQLFPQYTALALNHCQWQNGSECHHKAEIVPLLRQLD